MPRVKDEQVKKETGFWGSLIATLGQIAAAQQSIAANTSKDTSRTWDRWSRAPGTWSYASATTITVPAGATSVYQKGDKIKITQSGSIKYFSVTAVADTLLTVTGGTDYSVANATITDAYYSKDENPQGFPDWFNYTPTTSGLTTPVYTIQTGKFKVSGRSVFAHYSISLSSWAGQSGQITLVAPITCANTRDFYGISTYYRNGGSSVDGVTLSYITANTTNIKLINNTDASGPINWDASTTTTFNGSIVYEI